MSGVIKRRSDSENRKPKKLKSEFCDGSKMAFGQQKWGIDKENICGAEISAKNRVDIPNRISLSERKLNKTVIKCRKSSANLNIPLKKRLKQKDQEIGASIFKQKNTSIQVLKLRKSKTVVEQQDENHCKPKHDEDRLRGSLFNSKAELSGEQQIKIKKVNGLEPGVKVRSPELKPQKQRNSLALNLSGEKQSKECQLNVDILWRKHFGCLPPKKRRTN